MDSNHYRQMGNVKILNMDKSLLLENLRERLADQIKTRIFFVNAHCFNIAQENLDYRRQLNEAEIVLNDGIGIELGAKFFNIDLKENLNGTDFTPEVLGIANSLHKSLYLLGGKPGVAETAGNQILKKFPNIRLVGVADGYFQDPRHIVSEINQHKPDLLLVGLGVPLQENWISEYIEDLDASVIMAVGAFLDFTSGTMKRAPLLIQKCRLEWAFRLFLEPKRMFKRYVFGNILFFFHILRLAKETGALVVFPRKIES